MCIPGTYHLLELLASIYTDDGRQYEHERADAGGNHHFCGCLVCCACQENVQRAGHRVGAGDLNILTPFKGEMIRISLQDY